MTGAGGDEGGTPLLLVTVGTDHHPFPRLLEWVGRWAAEHPRWRIEVQHGAGPAPRFGHSFAYCSHEDLRALLRASAVVVSHAGPATITQARALGHVPVVVPRDPRLGEHVDDHQILFARRLAAQRLLWLVESEAALAPTIEAAGDAAMSQDGTEPRVPPGVFRVAEVVEELVDTRRGQGAGRGPRSPGRRVARSRLRH